MADYTDIDVLETFNEPKGPPDIEELTSTSPIVSDKNLESTLNIGDYKYYVGMLRDHRLPVRVAPYNDGLSLGWSDAGYDLDGLSVAIGHPLEVVEVVESETGTWAGFISDGEILYTDVAYVRIKDGYTCPLISRKFSRPDDPIFLTYIPEGSRAISPKDNQNWLSLTPNDVRLAYYNFNQHNEEVVNEDYTIEGVNLNPTLRCSEGYYYFILGENARQSEAVTSGEIYGEYKSEAQIEADKLQESNNSIDSLKVAAFNNLLDYLGKKIPPEQENVGEMLRNEHFVLSGLKVNTQTVDPNNQRALFAIRSSYVDALPDKTFSEIYDTTSMAPYKDGKNYAFAVKLNELPKICADLVSKFKAVRSKLETSRLKILDVSDLEYDINIQIEQLERFPKEINNFLERQSFPALTDNSDFSLAISEGTRTLYDHIIQFAIADNNTIGCGVRETIAYVLFSPDPKSLTDPETLGNINLFDFDPFITDAELYGDSGIKRSAVHLKTALPYIREVYDGAYGSRTLHLIMAHSSITKFLNTVGGDLSSYDWAEFLQKYCVPPLKIYPSKDPQQFTSVDDLDCDELIQQLNAAGPNVGRQEKLLQEKLYNNPRCKEMYFEQFKDSTHAGDPSLSTKGLEEASEDMRLASSSGAGSTHTEYISIIFQQFFHILDPMALMSLIMACLQKKLGIPLSIEAICEAAIIELVKTLGTETMTSLLITAAFATPQSEVSQRILSVLGDPNSPYYNPEARQSSLENADTTEDPYAADRRLKLDERYDGAPIATALVVGEIDIIPDAIEVIRNMEKAGLAIQLKLAQRAYDVDGTISPSGKAGALDPHVDQMSSYSPGEVYTQKEVDSETNRLKELGYTSSEVQALMVQGGYMVPDEVQWGLYVNYPNSFKDAPRRINYQTALESVKQSSNYNPAADGAGVIKDAKAWLAYMKANVVDLSTLCELLVGDILDGLEFLMKDPHAFLGGFGDWWEDFMNALKRAFSFNLPSLNFPENLSTDSHMGDYSKKLLDALLSMVAMIFGEIAQLLIKEALEKCLEENNDQGPSMNPVNSRRPASETIPNIRTADIPKLTGISDEDVIGWMKDLIDNLSIGQLCALLRGDASKKTLNACLSRTEIEWPQIYNAGINTIYEIRVAFEKLGRSLPNLDICNVLTASSPVVTEVCEAIYNSDARCEELQKAGLTKEECDRQIQDELNDLKNKLIDLSSLGMFGMSPSASGQYGLPSPCSEGGFFELPPGVRDSMTRITDNLLTTVKSSLIQDLSSLEFFSVPPRAILAATDPEEMKKAYNMFSNTLRNPYYKIGFAYIGNPWNVTNYPEYEHGLIGSHKNTGAFKWYPLTYNKYLHYGAMATEGWGIDWKRSENTVKTRKEFRQKNRQAAIRLIETAMAGEGGGHLTSNPFFYGWHPSDDSTLTWVENFLENAVHFEPMHYGALLKTDKVSPAKGWTAAENNNAKWELIQERYDDRPPFKDALNKVRVRNGVAPSSALADMAVEDGEKINQDIVDMFKEPIKPMYLRELILDVEQLQDMNYNPIGPIPTSFPASNTAIDIASPDINPIGLPLFEIDGSHGSDTKWLGMLRNFTGYDLEWNDKWLGQDAAGDFMSIGLHFTAGKWPVLDTSKGNDGFRGDAGPSSLSTKVLKGLKVSPGLVKLWKMFKQMADPEYEPPQIPDPTDTESGDTIDGTQSLDSDSTILKTFMQLTLYEALGLDAERCGSIFSSFGPILPESIEGVILSFGKEKTRVITAPGKQAKTKSDDMVSATEWATNQPGNLVNRETNRTYTPQYIVFRQYFADPESPLSFEKEKMIEFFSSDKDKVNTEMYNSLTREANFNQHLGFVNDVVPNPISTYDPGPDKVRSQKSDPTGPRIYSRAIHYDPDIIKIVTSFTELASKKVAGFDGSKITEKILSKLRSQDNASETFQSILGQLDFVNKKDNLIYQNVALPLENNISSQLVNFRDMFKFVKGKLNSDAGESPDKNIVGSENEIGKEKYNFNFGKKLDSDVQDLVQDLFKDESGETIVKKMISDHPGYSSPRYNPLNFKAQVFGKLLSRRFIDMYNDYKPSEANTLLLNGNFEKTLKHSLANSSFPALQMAYVHQSFAKLKHSRLHERGMMKKLWKKILKNPINSSSIDPRCLDAAAGYTAASRDDLQNSETDFFNLDDVKQRILAFYEKSICHDVYEKSSPEDNAARIALLQGCVILLVKIYTLEVCLASLIAWDSYDVSDVVKEDILVKIIIKNIKEDINLDMIAYIANDVLRKEKGLSDVEMAHQRGKQSGLEYLVKAEGQNVTKTIKGMFINSIPMTSDLNLEILKSSNVDVDSVAKKIWFSDDPAQQQISASAKTAEIAAFYDQTGQDFIIDARFGSNIYTMNYGDGAKHLAPRHDDEDASAPSGIGTAVHGTLGTIDLFDKKTWDSSDRIRQRNNRNFLHSLPMSHRGDAFLYNNTWLDIPGAWADDDNQLSAQNSKEAEIQPLLDAKEELYESVYQAIKADWNQKLSDSTSNRTSAMVAMSQAYTTWQLELATAELEEGMSLWSEGYYNDARAAYEAANAEHGAFIKERAEVFAALDAAYEAKHASGDFGAAANKTLFDAYQEEPFFDIDAPDWSEFKVLNNRRKSVFERSTAFTKENFVENTMGTDLNRLLGNVIIQPYMKVTHISEDEKDNYWSNMSTRHSYEVDGSDTDEHGEPCEPDYTYSSEFNANHPAIRAALDMILSTLDEGSNVFRCYMLGYNGKPAYIPISAWSHFYNTIFVKRVMNFDSPAFPEFNPLKDLYNKYGFQLICKKYKIGLRMTYSVPTDNFDNSINTSSRKIKNVIEAAFTGQEKIKGLKACKSLYVQRPYFYQGSSQKRIMTEMHIPIAEVEREVRIQEDTGGLTIEGDERLFSLEEMGFWAPGVSNIGWNAKLSEVVTIEEEKFKYLTKTPYTFFYKYLAQDLVKDLKNSPEFKLIFDHCLPLRRYMTLGFVYASDGLSKFITEPTDVLDETKKRILMIIQNIMSSQDYKFVPDDVMSSMGDISLRGMGGTTGKEPDMTKLILKIIYKTMFMILKGFVELTDPAVIIAKLIIDIANAVVTTTLSLVEQGLTIAKQVQQGVKIAGDTALQTALMQLKVAASMVDAAKSSIPGVGSFIEINTDNINENYTPTDEAVLNINGVDDNGEIEEGSEFKTVYDGLSAVDKETVDRFIEQFLKVNLLFDTFIEAKQFLDEANQLLEDATSALDTFKTDAKETLEDLFQSPLLLPGLWAAMLPSMIPYGGGIIPFPFFAGPPSTIPGMIYIALLLIDAIEQKQHDDIFGADLDCDDQL